MPSAPPLPSAFLSAPIAHRGLHDRAAGVIENSLAAARAAADAGFGVEIDLQLSADGEAMVFHDDDLVRLTGREGAVGDFAAAALSATPLLDAVPSQTPPRFATLLAALDGSAPLLVEIKRQTSEAATRVLAARACALLDGYAGLVALMSFDPTAVLACAEAAPDLPRGLTSMDYAAAAARGDADAARISEDARDALGRMSLLDAAGGSFVSYRWQDLPTPRTEALREAGIPVLCWTTRSTDDDDAARRHADNVTFEGYRPRA